MSEQQDKLSQLLDEFTDDGQGLRALDEVEADVNLQYRLRRYTMIGQVMRHELPEQVDTDFNARVMAEINKIGPSDEDAVDREINPGISRSVWTWSIMKPFAGLAVAASVAVLSISLWQSVNFEADPGQVSEQVVSVDQQQADQQKIELLASQPVQTNAVPASSSLNNGMRWKTNSNAPELQQKLNAYLVNHTEYSNSMQGLIPQARVAGFDDRQ